MRRILATIVGMCACLLSFAIPAVGSTQGPPVTNIIGGDQAKKAYSWHVSLNNGCGGSLVAAQWIVTANHCGSATQGRIGSLRKNSGGEVVRIDRRITRPGTDLTLMHLSAPARSTPVQMATSKPAVGTPVRLLGYGCTSWPSCSNPSTLRQIDLTIVSTSECPAGNSGDVCVSGDSEHSACHGDSGGPAVVGGPGKWTLVGETHGAGDNNAECAGTTVYTNIAANLSWINKQLKNSTS